MAIYQYVRIGHTYRKAVICPALVSVFILSNNVPASQTLRVSFPLPLSCLIKVIFILFLSIFSTITSTYLIPVKIRFYLPVNKHFIR